MEYCGQFKRSAMNGNATCTSCSQRREVRPSSRSEVRIDCGHHVTGDAACRRTLWTTLSPAWNTSEEQSTHLTLEEKAHFFPPSIHKGGQWPPGSTQHLNASRDYSSEQRYNKDVLSEGSNHIPYWLQSALEDQQKAGYTLRTMSYTQAPIPLQAPGLKV